MPSLSFIYRPHPSWGLEINLSGFSATTHLDDQQDMSAGVYTRSKIDMSRMLAGLNYSLPFKKIRPFVGFLAGYTHAVTTVNLSDIGKYTSFSWSLQTGVDFYFSPVVGLKLSGALITTPNISNNSAYFDVGKSGSGFPTFAVGDPSTATIKQWNIGLGLSFRFSHKKKVN